MNKQQFCEWSKSVRELVYQSIQNSIVRRGRCPEAIIVGGEYIYAFTISDPMEIQCTADGMLLWRGIPLLRCGAVNKVKVVWNMEDIDLPEPPKET